MSSSHGLLQQSTTTGVAQTTQVYCLTAPEAGRPASRWQQGRFGARPLSSASGRWLLAALASPRVSVWRPSKLWCLSLLTRIPVLLDQGFLS